MAPPRNALLPRKTHEMSFRDPESKTFTQPPRVFDAVIGGRMALALPRIRVKDRSVRLPTT